MYFCRPWRTLLKTSAAIQHGAKTKSGGINFGTLPDLIGYRIKRAYAYSVQTFMDSFEELGLAYGQYSVLLLIELNPGLSQFVLAAAAGLDGSTIVPITNRFAKLGWIRRVRRQDDRRVYSLQTTPRGKAILARARALLAAHEEDLISALTTAERASLLRLLTKITVEIRSIQGSTPSSTH